jgi:hypothetical protein
VFVCVYVYGVRYVRIERQQAPRLALFPPASAHIVPLAIANHIYEPPISVVNFF